MINNLEEQLKLLVELQGLDTQIFKLEDTAQGIPEKIKQMEETFKEKSVNLKKAEDGVRTLQLKRKAKEGELEGKEGTIKKYQAQLYQVKTNKEYSALQEEIARVRADNSLIEEDIIKILDQIDAENKKVGQEKEFLKQEETKLAEDKKKLDEEKGRAEKEAAGLKTKRAALEATIDKAVLAKYEKIIKNRGGLAVVPVDDETCQGCFQILPPQVINEIRMHKDLIFCENCTRILYIEE